MLEVLRNEPRAPRLQGSTHHQGIPEADLMEAVEVDGRQNVFVLYDHEVEVGEQLDLPPRRLCRHAQLAYSGDEILLQDLGGNDTPSLPSSTRKELQGNRLFPWRVSIIRVDQDVWRRRSYARS